MTEYIDREAFIEDIKAEITNLKLNGWKGTPRPCDELYGFIDRIKEQPSVDDVVPVLHGKWVTHYRSGTPVAEGYVSTCCDMWNNRKSNYCPNCGAKMNKEGEGDV